MQHSGPDFPNFRLGDNLGVIARWLEPKERVGHFYGLPDSVHVNQIRCLQQRRSPGLETLAPDLPFAKPREDHRSHDQNMQ